MKCVGNSFQSIYCSSLFFGFDIPAQLNAYNTFTIPVFIK